MHPAAGKSTNPRASGRRPAVMTGLALPILAASLWSRSSCPSRLQMPFPTASRHGWQLAAVALGAVAMLVLGILDDQRDLSPRWKFLGQVLIALVVAASGIRVTIFVESGLQLYHNCQFSRAGQAGDME